MEGKLDTQLNCCYCGHFQAWNLYSYMAVILKDKEMAEISEQPTSWKIRLEPMTCNIVIFEVEAVMNVVLSEVEKHVLYGGLTGATECSVVLTDFNCTTYSLLISAIGICHLQVKIPLILNISDKSFPHPCSNCLKNDTSYF